MRGSLNWGPFTWLNGVAKTYGWWNDRRHSYDEGFHTYSMEWNASFKKGVPPGKTAVVQICSRSKILVLHISQMPRPPVELARILADPAIIKTGVHISGDARKWLQDL